MAELEKLLEGAKVADKTKTAYRYAYNKLVAALEKDLLESREQTIIDVIPTLSQSNNSRSSYLNIAFMIFAANGKGTARLERYREQLKQEISKERDAGNVVKLANLPSRKQLDTYLNGLYVAKEWQKYIINYLIMNNYVRNKDVDVLIVKRIGKDKDENYLVLRSYDVLYSRGDYKTFNTYGEKQNQIKSKKFRDAVINFLKQEGNITPQPLLTKINGERINKDSLVKYIKSRTYNELPERDIMKININHIDKTGDLRKLRQISMHRGTSVGTLISNYNLEQFTMEERDGEEIAVDAKGAELVIGKVVEAKPLPEVLPEPARLERFPEFSNVFTQVVVELKIPEGKKPGDVLELWVLKDKKRMPKLMLTMVYGGEKAGDIVERRIRYTFLDGISNYTYDPRTDYKNDWYQVIGKSKADPFEGKRIEYFDKVGKDTWAVWGRNEVRIYKTTGLEVPIFEKPGKEGRDFRKYYMKKEIRNEYDWAHLELFKDLKPIRTINLTTNPNLPLHNIENPFFIGPDGSQLGKRYIFDTTYAGFGEPDKYGRRKSIRVKGPDYFTDKRAEQAAEGEKMGLEDKR